MIILAEIDPAWLFFAGCAMLTIMLLKRTYRRIGRRHKSSNVPIERVHRPSDKWDGVQRDALAQIERQKVDMYEMSRDLNGQLNTKIIVLEQLISQSQQQIERMEQLLEEAESVQ
ncbi:MAG: hypothetical protein CMJ72_08180 [Planctomycetaceae bacterium]|nr:hypothetical protein [Planctomycetaceae bacterium]MCH2594417.1 hypothetical protein [Pirellulales bacterium]HCK40023.1 hypothetical protein [Planctomycetaceae bacterium]|tara:strand:- start:443 stop:787 length:345 start_codon:yes stop_codon:yes gene_type:complete